MSDDIVRFQPTRKVEQLTREQLKSLTPEQIEQARVGGHLDALLSGKKPEAAKEEPSPIVTQILADVDRAAAARKVQK